MGTIQLAVYPIYLYQLDIYFVDFTLCLICYHKLDIHLHLQEGERYAGKRACKEKKAAVLEQH